QQTRTITVEQVRGFHRRTFRPDRAMLVVIGSFDAPAARKLIDAAFAGLTNPARGVDPRPGLKPGECRVAWDVSTRHLLLAWPAPACEDGDHPALSLASLALMQRLFQDAELKSSMKHPIVSNEIEGAFLVNVQGQPAADPRGLAAQLLDRVGKLAQEPGLSEAELAMLQPWFVQLAKRQDLKNVPLPANVSRTMARANLELQRMMREILWGDLEAY